MQSFLFESSLSEAMRTTVLPRINAVRKEGAFLGFDGTPLPYSRYSAPNARGTVLILHGFTECREKYAELIYYFLCADLSVLIYDQRGHGSSPRTVREQLIHVDRFEDYVNDLEAFLDQVLSKESSPLYLYAHSMGGAVGALYLERGTHPFRKAILTSPMIATRHGPIPHLLAEGICHLLALLGQSKRRIFVMREPDRVPGPIERSSMLSPARFAVWNKIRRNRPYCGNAAATVGWTRASLGVTRKILKKGAPEGIEIPVRIYAAEREHLVRLDAQAELAARVPQGELQMIAGSKHEIYAATDDILHPYLESVLSFFEVE